MISQTYELASLQLFVLSRSGRALDESPASCNRDTALAHLSPSLLRSCKRLTSISLSHNDILGQTGHDYKICGVDIPLLEDADCLLNKINSGQSIRSNVTGASCGPVLSSGPFPKVKLDVVCSKRPLTSTPFWS